MKSKLWHFCNVFLPGAGRRRLWQFQSAQGQLKPAANLTLGPDESPPRKLIDKKWIHLWQTKSNIVWYSAERVYLRVLHLPPCDPEELPSMVEFQLEKISPLPSGQIVWSLKVVPSADENLQTVVVYIVEREPVEEELERLESSGFVPDRLELPFFSELLAHVPEDSETQIFAEPAGDERLCLIAWWQKGVLRNLNLLQVSNDESGARSILGHLSQSHWAGEMEGWIQESPRWKLIATEATAQAWLPVLHEWAKKEFERAAPAGEDELAESIAKESRGLQGIFNLLPSEYATRYRQQFVDRLWMRGLAAVLALYLLAVLAYFGAVQFTGWQKSRVESRIARLEAEHKKALELEARVHVLQEQLSLKFAALDCLLAVARYLPPELDLTDISFSRGVLLSLHGTAPGNKADAIEDFNSRIAKATVSTGVEGEEQMLFAEVSAPNSQKGRGSGAQNWSWSFTCELRREDIETE